MRTSELNLNELSPSAENVCDSSQVGSGPEGACIITVAIKQSCRERKYIPGKEGMSLIGMRLGINNLDPVPQRFGRKTSNTNVKGEKSTELKLFQSNVSVGNRMK